MYVPTRYPLVRRSILVALEDDLVDSCRPGDDVVVVGSLVRRWKCVRNFVCMFLCMYVYNPPPLPSPPPPPAQSLL